VRGGRVYQGTGLGLSICRRLLESIEGTISVESEVGRGSTFVVRIPHVAFAVTLSAESEAAKAGRFALPADFAALIVDDVPMNQLILARHLQRLGVDRRRIHGYASAREALQALDDGLSPSLILTDLWMPGMNGEAFARAVRGRPAFAKTPIVAQTADADSSSTFDSSVFRMTLTKPITGDVLRRMFFELYPVIRT